MPSGSASAEGVDERRRCGHLCTTSATARTRTTAARWLARDGERAVGAARLESAVPRAERRLDTPAVIPQEHERSETRLSTDPDNLEAIAKGGIIRIIPDLGPERVMRVSHVEHHIITLAP